MTLSDTAFTPLVVPRVGETPTDVRDEAARARTRGYAEGFAEGRRIALDEARAQRAAEAERLQQERDAQAVRYESALTALDDARSAVVDRVRTTSALSADRIEELAVELAAAILGAELSDPARSAAHALRRALAEMPVDRWTRVAVHPRDGEILRADADAVAALHGVEMIDDASLSPGGAIVQIADGAVDVRVAEALRRASDALSGGDRDDDGDREALA
ncbi:flagellar assembly protein FliH [Microbacterium sp. kSW2-24]|uniref:FliH/SctL family protein n=1 Tax=Microbacterium galbinum TaxID=2851646 RepID=UPI001FFCC7CD|nr:FliH/SctL family protein [Microbacterium galbinum]MCK2021592.1 flagellar assembly protein FliH [Microbacterium galbinum]